MVADNADRPAIDPSEAADNVLCPTIEVFKEVTVIDDRTNDIDHVVGLVGVLGKDVSKLWTAAIRFVVSFGSWRHVEVVRREEIEQ